MRKKSIFLLAFIILAAILLLLFYRSNGQQSASISELTPQSQGDSKKTLDIIALAKKESEVAAQRAEEERQRAYIKKLDSDPEFAASELQRLLDTDPRAKKMYKIIEASTFPIAFYGKVIDGASNPISNVAIRYSIGPAYGIGQPINGETVTDSDGLYVVKGEGSMVSLLSFAAPGYDFANSAEFFVAAPEPSRPLTWSDHDADNPFVTVGVAKQD